MIVHCAVARWGFNGGVMFSPELIPPEDLLEAMQRTPCTCGQGCPRVLEGL